MRRGVCAALLAASFLFFSNAAADSTPSASAPHFMSLRTEGANGRRGPGIEHRIDWIYQRRDLPLEVIGQSGPWRRVRDPDGTEVWMHVQNLEERATAYVREPATLRRSAREAASPVAYLAPGVVGAVTGCQGEWRRLAVAGRVGWVRAEALWGAGCAAG